MSVPKIFESEYRFCLILWEREPVRSTELVRLCKERLGWSKATTYTVIKRLADRGVLVSEDAVVRSLVSKDQVRAAQIDELTRRIQAQVRPIVPWQYSPIYIRVVSSSCSVPVAFRKRSLSTRMWISVM